MTTDPTDTGRKMVPLLQMIFYCQSCGEQHTMLHVASANITSCAKCGGQSFATWKPAALLAEAQSRLASHAERGGVVRDCCPRCDQRLPVKRCDDDECPIGSNCTRCKGRGKVAVRSSTDEDDGLEDCGHCDGTGRAPSEASGLGEVAANEMAYVDRQIDEMWFHLRHDKKEPASWCAEWAKHTRNAYLRMAKRLDAALRSHQAPVGEDE